MNINNKKEQYGQSSLHKRKHLTWCSRIKNSKGREPILRAMKTNNLQAATQYTDLLIETRYLIL